MPHSQPKSVTPDAAVELVARMARQDGADGTVLLPGGAMEAQALAEGFARRPELAAGLCFTGLPVPGVNRTDWAALHPQARMRVCLPSTDWAATVADGRTALLPVHYSAFFAQLAARHSAVQVLHLSAPDAAGLCSLSCSADLPAGLGRFTLGFLNAAAPRVAGAPAVPLGALDAICRVDHPLRTVEPAAGGPAALVEQVASLVPDGATVQTGIGRLPGAILSAFANHRQLCVHSGLLGADIGVLLDSGAIAAPGCGSGSGTDFGPVTAGLLLGDMAFYRRMANEPRLRLVPVSQTHGHEALAARPRLRAINAALEADLTGQINCEYAGTRRIGGIGGALDFMRGARASAGGLAITLIQAGGKDGASRIVERLEAPCVSIGRADADVIVSEYGTAALRDASEQERPELMRALAPPAARASLGLAPSRGQSAP